MDIHEDQSSSYESLKIVGRISPTIRNHLKMVYLTLCCTLGASSIGASMHILMNIGGVATFIGSIISIAWLFDTPPYEEKVRFAVLIVVSLFEGATVGPLIQLVIDFEPSIIVTAFVGMAMAFGCFSGAAILARRREFLYLGGLLGSSISILIWLQLASSIFGHTSTLLNFELYLGLLMFLGYVVYDTQEIIEKAYTGDQDYVYHALTLFIDFIGVIVGILIIMLNNASEKYEEKKKKRRC